MKVLLIVLQLAASGSDAYFTHRNNLLPRHYENNPIAAPFVRTTHAQVIYFSTDAALKITVSQLVRRHHPKLGTGIAVWGIADNTYGAAFSATH